jgi:hypothetical protein
MPTILLFDIQLVLGYVACGLCFAAYIQPRFRAMDRAATLRAIATLHSFRFFGLVFILPGVVGADLPQQFAAVAAWGDFATGVLAILALLAVRWRGLFWLLALGFNVVGTTDLVMDYANAILSGMPVHAGELGAAYAIPILYVPMLMITHVYAFYRLFRTGQVQAMEVRAFGSVA